MFAAAYTDIVGFMIFSADTLKNKIRLIYRFVSKASDLGLDLMP